MCIDCRTCANSRIDNFRGIRYCRKSNDYCHGEVVSHEGTMEADRYTRFVPDSGNCPGMESLRGLRSYND